MARVVSQRSGPPYLLIIFVFLFVVSTAIAVLVYLELDKARIALAESEEMEAKFASNRERKSARVTAMLKAYDQAQAKHDRDPRKNLEPQSVFAQQERIQAMLVELITGNQADSPDVAIGRSREAFTLTGRDAGLAEQVIALKDQLNDIQNKQMPAQAKRILKVVAERKAGEEQIAALKASFLGDRAKLRARIAAVEGTQKAEHDDYLAELGKLAKQSKEDVAKLNKRIAELTGNMEKLQFRLQEKDIKIAALEKDRDKRRGTKEGSEQPFRKPVGTIAKIQDDNDGLCYIDIGRQDHIKPGLTFSVYPGDGFGDESTRKGSILVTSVLNRVSICRITDAVKGNPIVKGDVLENIAFDPAKVFLFVVDGDFDLSGRAAPTPEGIEEVKALIRRYGGKVVDTLTAQTDFVVLGAAPSRPSKPTEDEPAQVRHVRQEQQKIWKRYQDVNRLARERRIPILNQNRFIALTGYAAPPDK